MYNSKFTKNCTSWGLKYAHNRDIKMANDPRNDQIYKLNLDERGLFRLNDWKIVLG